MLGVETIPGHWEPPRCCKTTLPFRFLMSAPV
jgi:hypothetical protein